DSRDFHALRHDLEGDLLEVEDNVGGVLDDARNRAEFVVDALDFDGRNRRALDRAEEYAPQAIADSGSESALERLRGELAEPIRQVLGIGHQTLGFLKALEHRNDFLISSTARR